MIFVAETSRMSLKLTTFCLEVSDYQDFFLKVRGTGGREKVAESFDIFSAVEGRLVGEKI